MGVFFSPETGRVLFRSYFYRKHGIDKSRMRSHVAPRHSFSLATAQRVNAETPPPEPCTPAGPPPAAQRGPLSSDSGGDITRSESH